MKSERTSEGSPPSSDNRSAASVIYISYDGIDEPLGRSQVLAYLECLSQRYRITLISFEKPGAAIVKLRPSVAAAGIDWRPLRYHRRPPILSTAFDVVAGRRALSRAARESSPDVVHVRSYVAALIALPLTARTNAKLLFDIRGFWADERVDGGLWKPGGALYRIAKRYERRFFDAADGVVTLTSASVPQIESWLDGRDVPIEVIPTCVDAGRFEDRPPRGGEPHAVWSGSIGTWYRFDLAPRLASALAMPLTVVSRQVDLAREVLAGYPASVTAVRPEDMPSELFAQDVGLCLVRPSFSKVASTPTRFAEFLAAGMSVVVTPGVGDLEAIVDEARVGVVLRGDDDQAVATAVEQLRALRSDPGLVERCRAVARDRFNLPTGVAAYSALYDRLSAG